MRLALCKSEDDGLYCMIQYSNGLWMRVANYSYFKCDNTRYILEHFPDFALSPISGDRENAYPSQISGKYIIKIKEITGEVPVMKKENFIIDHRGSFHYIDDLCRMEFLDMELFPEIFQEMKEEFYRLLQKEIKRGVTVSHISNKGMGRVSLPSGTLISRSNDGVAILPCGTVAKSFSHGSGRDFGYTWEKTDDKLDNPFSSAFCWWNWVVATGKVTTTTALFGARHGQDDTL